MVARGVSALQPERESFLQELGLAGLQVWQSLSEATGRGRGDQPLALLFTDLVGFSSWALKAGDAATLELLREVGAAEEAAVITYRGRIVKRLGDGLMASFLTVQDAVEAGLVAHELVAGVERRTATRRGCAPASTTAGRGGSEAICSESTSTSPRASATRRRRTSCSSPTSPRSCSTPRGSAFPGRVA